MTAPILGIVRVRRANPLPPHSVEEAARSGFADADAMVQWDRFFLRGPGQLWSRLAERTQ